jgi:NADH-quinone oxidoreductase subunit C
VTSSPPETEDAAVEEGEDAAEAPHPLVGYATEVGRLVGGEAEITFDTIKVTVDSARWLEVLAAARDELDLVLFSFLSAVDWSNDVAVGDSPDEALAEDFFEVLCTVSDLTVGRRVTFATRLGHDRPSIASLRSVYAGADWHEREAHEMFGIDFEGHPDLAPLYLPDGFLGHPLLKSYPLLSREVKPWPGKVDVEGMPDEDETEEEAAGEGEEES